MAERLKKEKAMKEELFQDEVMLLDKSWRLDPPLPSLKAQLMVSLPAWPA